MRSTLFIWLLAAALFVSGVALYTFRNDFPFYYHPDEPGKVRQVLSKEWNFNHPMLLLSTTRAAAGVVAEVDHPQEMVRVGRSVSAVFTAGAVALFCVLVWWMAGGYAAAVAGLLLLTNRQLFELAHYFKEDTALLFGMAVWFVAFAWFWKRPGLWAAALVGAGAALATSGKYMGALTIGLSLVLLPLRLPRGRRLWGVLLFVAVGVALFAVVNLPLLLDSNTFRKSFSREVGFVVEGQRGLTRSVPHAVYFDVFRTNVFFLLWPVLGWFYWRCWQRRRELSGGDWLVVLFPVVYMVLLSFSPKENDRYFFPATALFLCAVGMGAASLRERWKLGRGASAALLLVLVGGQLPALVEYVRAYRHDDLAELTQWLNTELPDAVLAQDRKVMLPAEERSKFLPYQPKLLPRIVGKNVEKLGSLEALREAGVTHVVLSESSYGRYFRRSLRPQKGGEDKFEQARALYETLRAKQPPLWERKRDTVIYLHPGLEVYKLP